MELFIEWGFEVKKFKLMEFEILRFTNKSLSVVPTGKRLVHVAKCLVGNTLQNTDVMDREL